MCASRRIEKVSSLLKITLGEILISEIKDRSMGIVTVTDVVLTNDMGTARVYYSIIGGTKNLDKQKNTVSGLVKHIRKCLASKIILKYTPRLYFIYDDTAEKALQIEKVLKKIRDKDDAR